MPSFLDKLRSGNVAGAVAATTGVGKKDAKDSTLSWRQRLQQDNDPVRADGSDKFWGAENFGNTCYLNSMVQSLYNSVPFRDMVLAYPAQSPLSTVLNDADGNPRKHTDTSQANGAAASPSKPATVNTSAAKPVASGPQKPEDKESPDYKKKQAKAAGPLLNIDYDNSTTYGMNASLFTGLKDAFEAVVASNSRTGVISLGKILETLRADNAMFQSPMHQDAHEFLNILLNAVIESVEEHTKELERNGVANGSANKSEAPPKALITAEESKRRHAEFKKLFQGTLTSETKCLTCEQVSQRDEPFLDLSVDLEQHSSVTSCLRQFSAEEMLCERDKFFCDKCGGLQEAERRMKVKQLPRILALHLKRFTYTEDLQRLPKLFHRVVYPYHLRLFNTTDDPDDPDKLYELYSVVVHIGSGPYHGHYVSIIKTPERGWLLYDDESVEPVDKSFVKNFFGAQVGMACAYVLFYQETTLEAVKKEQEAEGLAAASTAAAEVHQPPLKDSKEFHGLSLGLKINGIVGGGPSSPTGQDDETTKLSQVVSAPASTQPVTGATSPGSPPIPPVPFGNGLSPNGSAKPTPPSPATPTAKKADKKQAAKEEKERKAAEKEREKAEKAAEKARRKSLETRSKTQATAIKSTVAQGKSAQPAPSTGNGSVDGTASNAATTNGANTAPTLPTPAPPTVIPSDPDGDEIAPAPLPSMSQATANTSTAETKPAAQTSTTNTTPASTATTTSGKDANAKDTSSGWSSKSPFSSLSVRRKSLGKKPKLWDRFGPSDSKGLAVPSPTSNPSTITSAGGPSTLASSASAPASGMPAPNPPLSAQGLRADEFAVDDTDSGPENDRDIPPPPPPKDVPPRIAQSQSQSPALPPRPSVTQPTPYPPQFHHHLNPGSPMDLREGGGGGRSSAPPAATGAAASLPPSAPAPAQTNVTVPAARDLGIEVPPPGQQAGKETKKRGFSSIRKKASNLLS